RPGLLPALHLLDAAHGPARYSSPDFAGKPYIASCWTPTIRVRQTSSNVCSTVNLVACVTSSKVPMETCIFSPAIAMAAVAQKMTMIESSDWAFSKPYLSLTLQLRDRALIITNH